MGDNFDLGIVDDFGVVLGQWGFPAGLWLAWTITVVEIAGGTALAAGLLVRPLALWFIVQLAAGIYLIHARAGWFVNDLHRHGFAWLGFPLLARIYGWHQIVRLDGTTSIARSYRPAEWPSILAEAGIEGARVRRRFPFRLCVERIR